MDQQSTLASTQSTCTVRAPKPGDYGKMAELAGQLGYPSTTEQVRMRLEEWRSRTSTPLMLRSFPEAKSQGGSECTCSVLSNKMVAVGSQNSGLDGGTSPTEVRLSYQEVCEAVNR